MELNTNKHSPYAYTRTYFREDMQRVLRRAATGLGAADFSAENLPRDTMLHLVLKLLQPTPELHTHVHMSYNFLWCMDIGKQLDAYLPW